MSRRLQVPPPNGLLSQVTQDFRLLISLKHAWHISYIHDNEVSVVGHSDVMLTGMYRSMVRQHHQMTEVQPCIPATEALFLQGR